MESTDIMAFAGVIAACVGVIKTFQLFDEKWNPLVAIALAAIFVLSPKPVQDVITAILVLGLTASGHYHYNKNRPGKGDPS